MAIRFEPLHREKAVRVMEELSVPQGETLARLSDGSPGKALHLAEAEALMWRERALFIMEGIEAVSYTHLKLRANLPRYRSYGDVAALLIHHRKGTLASFQ